jgi:hypothetical protein
MTDTSQQTGIFKCPKCHYPQNPDKGECAKCGVLFAKYYASVRSRSKNGEDGNAPSSPQNDDASFSLNTLFFYTKPHIDILSFSGRLIVYGVMILWGGYFMLSPLEDNAAGNSILHLVNLPFHEAGHVFFRPFGAFVTSLGGTLGQLLMPLICLSVLLLSTRDTFGASATLWWFGQNFFDIAPYMNDAISLTMPLVGGNFGHSSPYGFHDWEYLLTESGLLQHAHFLAKMCMTMGAIVVILASFWGAILLLKQYKNLS